MQKASHLGLSLIVVAALCGSAGAKTHSKTKQTKSDTQIEKTKTQSDSTAQSTEASTQEVVVPPEKMKEAVDLYTANKFIEAYKIFSELFEIKPDDARINFYLGRCSTELKKYDDALEAFERVLMIEPTHVRSRIEIARVYFEEQNFDNSEAEFNKALEYPMPDEVKAQIKMFLQAIADSRQKNFISGAFIVGMDLDTNVANDIGQVSYVPQNLANLGPISGKKPVYDYSFSETLAVNDNYKINKDGWSWANSLVLYNKQYRQAVGSNILFMQIGSGLAYDSPKYKVSITPTIENLKYGMTHTSPSIGSGIHMIPGLLSKIFMVDRLTDTMDAVGISEKFSMPLPDKMALDQSVSYKYQYFKTSDGMDAKAIEASIGLKKSYDNQKSASITITGSRNIQADPTKSRTDVDQNSQTLKIEYSMPVQKYFDLSLNASIKKVNYEDVDASFGVKQQDIQRSIGFTGTKMIDQTTIFSATFNKVYNTSTLENKIYQKTTAGVSLTKAF